MLLATLAASPWLKPKCFANAQLHRIAADVDELPLGTLELVKAFNVQNDADAALGSDLPPLQWWSTRESCASHRREQRLCEALREAGAPISARLSSGEDSAVTAALAEWLTALDGKSSRPHLNADAYLTCDEASSASLGWHVDDVDVLLVMLRGGKRFRVAGRSVGSPIVIDHFMHPGVHAASPGPHAHATTVLAPLLLTFVPFGWQDAIYIPALTFHSGGDSSSAATPCGSTLLSVAMPPSSRTQQPVAAAEATAAVAHWRRAREVARRALPDGVPNSWDAAGPKGAAAASMRSTLLCNDHWKDFALPAPADGDAGTDCTSLRAE